MMNGLKCRNLFGKNIKKFHSLVEKKTGTHYITVQMLMNVILFWRQDTAVF